MKSTSKKIPFCAHKIPFCAHKIPFCAHKAVFAFDLVYHISNGHVFNITDDHKIPILPKGEEKSPAAGMKNGFIRFAETKMICLFNARAWCGYHRVYQR